MGCPAVAVAPWLGCRRWFAPLDHLVIVLGDHPGHVGHCPVRDFHRVPVDDRSKRIAGGEAGVDDGQEGGGHVGLDRLVEGWVEPRDRPPPASPISFFIIPDKYRIMIKYELKNNSVKITRLYRVILLSV